MNLASEARWNAAYRKADTLYTAHECGCLVLVMVDMPDVIRNSKAEIVRESLAGRSLRRVPRGMLPPLRCELHQLEAEAQAAEAKANPTTPTAGATLAKAG